MEKEITILPKAVHTLWSVPSSHFAIEVAFSSPSITSENTMYSWGTIVAGEQSGDRPKKEIFINLKGEEYYPQLFQKILVKAK